MREWLRNARISKDMTMANMASRLGITESYYSYIENGERQKKMDITMLIKLSEILGMTADEIIAAERVIASD